MMIAMTLPQSLRIIVSSLSVSIAPVLNALAVMAVVTSLYAILGVIFYSGHVPSHPTPTSAGSAPSSIFAIFARSWLLSCNTDPTTLMPSFLSL